MANLVLWMGKGCKCIITYSVMLGSLTIQSLQNIKLGAWCNYIAQVILFLYFLEVETVTEGTQ